MSDIYRKPMRAWTRMAACSRWLYVGLLAIGLSACSGINFNPPPPVTVSEIVAMSRAGEPDKAIIERIRDSGTVYRLSASQLADLRQRGVSNQVIDYMQQTYLRSVRDNQRLQDETNWTPFDDGYIYGGYPFGWDDGWYPDDSEYFPPPDE